MPDIRQLPEQRERVESGPVQFGPDWPGVFIRGDNAFFYAGALAAALPEIQDPIARAGLEGLRALLASSDLTGLSRGAGGGAERPEGASGLSNEAGRRFYEALRTHDPQQHPDAWEDLAASWHTVYSQAAAQCQARGAPAPDTQPEESPAEAALRSLACWLGVGGYNAPTVDAALFEEKIREGVLEFSQLHGTAGRELAQMVLEMELPPLKGPRALARGTQARKLARRILEGAPRDAAAQARATGPAQRGPAPRCDGNHGGQRCGDPECWNDSPPAQGAPVEACGTDQARATEPAAGGELEGTQGGWLAPRMNVAAAMPNAEEIAARVRRLARGTEVWRVADPVTGAYCLEFTRKDCLTPESEAKEWLEDHQKRFPNAVHAHFVVQHSRVFTELEMAALDAAEALAPQPPVVAS
ncbi:hypothetical protein [Ramlibacter sp. AN1133]|uniref:hypothetical protein n=1 Tax=Ramlibacter sp. AN1133 TaxID=3133429 RepID=UPI0030BCD2DA